MSAYEFGPWKWKRIPLKVRVACGAAVVERVEACFSEHFRTNYHQIRALEVIWRFITETASLKDIDATIALLEKAVRRGEKELYVFDEIWMPGFLLEEIRDPDGRGVAGAIDAAAMSFQHQVLYKRGLIQLDPRLCDRIEEMEVLAEPVYEATRRAMKVARALSEAELSRESFLIELPNPLSPEVSRPFIDEAAKRPNRRYAPPIHEFQGKRSPV